MSGRFTGRHMTALLVCFFAVVVGVNLLMASLAHATFGGVVVKNSYVASQHFNRWLAAAEADRALGWEAAVRWRDDRRIALELAGVPPGARIEAVARHPLGRLPDRVLTFHPADRAHYVSDRELPDGRWLLRLEIRSGTDRWRNEVALP